MYNYTYIQFWEDEPDSDSEEEREETTQDVVNRWKTQSSNIHYGTQQSLVKNNNRPKAWNGITPNARVSPFGAPPSSRNNYMRGSVPSRQHMAYQPQPQQKPIRRGHQRVRSLYDASSSDDDEEEDDFDGFEKYTPPPKVVDVEAEKAKKRKEEEDYWKNNDTVWIVKELNKQYEYDTIWFTVPKMRNGKASGAQMKTFMENQVFLMIY